jgi:hypothetical protein
MLHRITIIILHYLVGASLNESDMIAVLANNTAGNRNNARRIFAPARPRSTPGHFLLLGDCPAANSTGSINVGSSASAFELLTRRDYCFAAVRDNGA